LLLSRRESECEREREKNSSREGDRRPQGQPMIVHRQMRCREQPHRQKTDGKRPPRFLF
jgi:hypothetical protein